MYLKEEAEIPQTKQSTELGWLTVIFVLVQVALEMLFTGEPLSAHEALMHGLVSKVVPEDKLEEETMKISQKICESSKSVLALGKATFYRQIAQDLDTAYKITTKVMVDNLTLRDGQEGIEAFVQKRKPVWSHSQEEKKWVLSLNKP